MTKNDFFFNSEINPYSAELFLSVRFLTNGCKITTSSLQKMLGRENEAHLYLEG